MEALSLIVNLLSLGGIVWVGYVLLRQDQREKAEITLKLKSKSGRKMTLFSIPRSELTRAEVLGRIGMIPMIKEKERERFKIISLNEKSFFDNLYSVKRDNGDRELVIECSDEEFNQFDLARFEATYNPK